LPRKKESKKAMAAGFGITVLALFGLFFGLVYFRPSVSVNHLPSTVPHYSTLWGRYVPADVSLFGFENYTAIRVYNSSYPIQYKVLLEIVNPKVSLDAPYIDSALTIAFEHPNESVAFAFVNQAAFNNFTTAFASVSFAAVHVGNDTMYNVQDLYSGQPQFGWLALIPADRGVAFALGASDAKEAVQLCLQVTPSNSLISKLDVRDMLYIANGTSNHLAIGVQAFPGVIPTANNTMTVVDASRSQVTVRRVLEFNSTSTAVADYGLVKQDYLASRAFTIYDPYVETTEYRDLSGVVSAVRLVE
jgi:hypothetical protein